MICQTRWDNVFRCIFPGRKKCFVSDFTVSSSRCNCQFVIIGSGNDSKNATSLNHHWVNQVHWCMCQRVPKCQFSGILCHIISWCCQCCNICFTHSQNHTISYLQYFKMQIDGFMLTCCGLVMQYVIYRSWSTLVEAMACCLMAPCPYLNQCWLLSRGCSVKAMSQ